MAKLWCHNSENPEPIDTKFDMGDYVGDVTLYAKIHKFDPNFARIDLRLNCRTDFYAI